MTLNQRPSAPRILGCIGLSGCISIIALILIIVAFVGGILFLITGSFKSSDVFKRAVAAAQADPAVAAELGSPIQAGWLITGSISEQGISGDADLVIPISGSRKSGTLYASARKGNGVWRFYTLAVHVDGSDRIITLEQSQ